jgi:GMP synthase (glutamine-hydrolysing)
MSNIKPQIVVLDFGGQYSHLIARRIRQLNVLAEIKDAEVDVDELREVKGIILSGGPSTVGDENSPKYNKEIFKLNIPILGICYGHQVMAHELGGHVTAGKIKEYGQSTVEIKKSKLFKELETKERAWMSHGDTVTRLPKGFKVIGSTEDCEAAAVADEKNNRYGVQFHPEVTHTPNGMKILDNFLQICKCKRDWDMNNFIAQITKDIKDKVKDNNVFLLVSGGVDSTVAFALLEKVLGKERVYGLHIDNGFMRKNESKKVKKELEKHGFKNLHVIDAGDDFLEAVKEVYDPEKKRKIIGKIFIDVQAKAVKEMNLDPEKWMLGQGTIYPDTIETAGTKNAALIKTHHNRVKEVQQLIEQGKVIEPLAELYKDEVREVGEKLGLPHELVWRHPFPGPGLAVRCLCVEKEDICAAEVNEITQTFNMEAKTLPIKSVGVQGDFRTYKHPAVLIGEEDWDMLEEVSTEITNKIKEVNRVVYLLNEVDVEKLKVKREYLTKARMDLLREADDKVNKIIFKHKLEKEIWQFPVVLVPLGLKGESIVLRPVNSKEAMTAEFARLPENVIQEIINELQKIKGIDAIFYDVTHKPPGTIEWE